MNAKLIFVCLRPLLSCVVVRPLVQSLYRKKFQPPESSLLPLYRVSIGIATWWKRSPCSSDYIRPIQHTFLQFCFADSWENIFQTIENFRVIHNGLDEIFDYSQFDMDRGHEDVLHWHGWIIYTVVSFPR